MRELSKYVCVALIAALAGTAAAIPLDESRPILIRMDDGNAPERVSTGQWGCPGVLGIIYNTEPSLPGESRFGESLTGGQGISQLYAHWAKGCSMPGFLTVPEEYTFGGTDPNLIANVKVETQAFTASIGTNAGANQLILNALSDPADPNDDPIFCAPQFESYSDLDFDIHEDGSVDGFYTQRIQLFFCAFARRE